MQRLPIQTLLFSHFPRISCSARAVICHFGHSSRSFLLTGCCCHMRRKENRQLWSSVLCQPQEPHYAVGRPTNSRVTPYKHWHQTLCLVGQKVATHCHLIWHLKVCQNMLPELKILQFVSRCKTEFVFMAEISRNLFWRVAAEVDIFIDCDWQIDRLTEVKQVMIICLDSCFPILLHCKHASVIIDCWIFLYVLSARCRMLAVEHAHFCREFGRKLYCWDASVYLLRILLRGALAQY